MCRSYSCSLDQFFSCAPMSSLSQNLRFIEKELNIMIKLHKEKIKDKIVAARHLSLSALKLLLFSSFSRDFFLLLVKAFIKQLSS